ncbi:hypothetical protein EIP86_001792 [Pleurotus ostreatoroseus]|nr:hypothetical protein EIP86_001792 [Pleurotus ostreatoroseus]
MSVIFQSFEDVADVPENVQRIVSSMRRLLRGAQRLASLPSMTPLALAQLQRIPKGGVDVDVGSSDDIVEEVSDVANLVLTTCAAMEERMNDPGVVEATPTIPHWYTLLRTIAKNCHQDAKFLGDISFIYPHGFGGESGDATVLAGFSVDEILISTNLHTPGMDTEIAVPLCMEQHLGFSTDQMSLSESGLGEDPSDDEHIEDLNMVSGENGNEGSDNDHDDSDGSDGSSYDELRDHPMLSAVPRALPIPDYDEAELVFGWDLVDEHEPPEEQCLDLPLETQILAEHRTWPAVYFPVICLASGEDIVPLVASSVYQRRTWNINLPIVALQVSRCGSLVHVNIGWADPSEIEAMVS